MAICMTNTAPCCCGVPLRTGVKLLAIILIVKDLIAMAHYAYTFAEDMEKADELENRVIEAFHDDVDGDDMALTKWFLFYSLIFLVTSVDAAMALILFIGASRGKVTHCRSWFWYGSLVLICSVAMLVDALLRDGKLMTILTGGISFIFYGYTLLLVGSLKEDLNDGKEQAARLIQQVEFVEAISSMEGYPSNSPFIVNSPLYPRQDLTV